MEKVIFYHVYLSKNYKQLVQEQLTNLFQSKLYNNVSNIFIGVNYVEEKDLHWLQNLISQYPKIQIILHKDNALEEKNTLRLILEFAKTKDCYICYFHTKGITRATYNTNQWRRLMEHYIIYGWENCIIQLESGYDSVGVLYRENTFLGFHPHYSGNYWWTNSKNILTLNSSYLDNNGDRYGAEFWIGSSHESKIKCLYEFNGTEPYNNEFLINDYIKL